MTQEKDFLELVRKTKSLIDEATELQKVVGVGNFLFYWDKYKYIIFPSYTKECVNSSSFRNYVWHMMCMTKFIDKNIEKEPPQISNVVNLNDYIPKRTII